MIEIGISIVMGIGILDGDWHLNLMEDGNLADWGLRIAFLLHMTAVVSPLLHHSLYPPFHMTETHPVTILVHAYPPPILSRSLLVTHGRTTLPVHRIASRIYLVGV